MEPTILANLSPLQAQVALSLAAGASVTSAAASTGAGRSTIHTWLKSEPNFTQAVETAQAEYTETLRDQLRDASAKALATLTAIMDDLNAPASVRLKAALAILNRPQFPDRGWTLPEKIEESSKEAFLDSMTQLEAMDRHRKLTERNKTEHNSQTSAPAQPATPNETIRNITEQFPDLFDRPQPFRSNKVGRNEPCPCGSGRKFKHCCIHKSAHPAASEVQPHN